MEKDEKIKVAITAGIAGTILLILVLFLALSGRKESDDEKLGDSISEYASAAEASNGIDNNAAMLSSTADEGDTGESAEGGEEISSDTTLYTEFENSQKSDISGNSFYATKVAVLKNVYNGITFDVQAQLKEMMTYWSDSNMEAVRDLAHLERFEAMSYELGNTTDFYYYGEKNSSGEPNGTGIAVYANDQYYYGGWTDGVRSGTGTWIAFYPDYSTYVVTEHMYTGEWAGDLPSGKGQDHYDYNPEYMNSEDIYLQNAIGTFDLGLYNGDMYIITVDKNDDIEEWYGKCDHGSWVQVLNTTRDKKGRIPVMTFNENPDRYLYMSEEGTQNSGVTGVITGGKQKSR